MPRHLRFLLFLALTFCAYAQTNVGRISGTITDATGAVVPDCRVSATNLQTGLTQTVSSENSGFFTFPSLTAGSYRVTAEKTGFRAAEVPSVTLDAASQRVVDFKLEVGELSQSVAVAATAELVQTSSGDVSHVITGSQVSELALNGRNYAQLLRLIPGVMATSTNPFTMNLATDTQRINGIRANSIYFNVDGAENMDNGANSNSIINPNVDAIAEIKILTSSYAAEFGGRSGGIVNVVTKSGSRDFHGSLFEFVRNDQFDARSFFAQKVDPLRFNDFGVTLGGPAFIPKVWNTDKNSLFFFVSEEWKYIHQGQTRVGTVPTLQERNGDFRGSSLPAPVDPSTGMLFPNGLVPATRFSYNGPLLLKPYPLPNFAGPGGNYSFTGISRTDTREDLLRFDYIPSSKTQIMYRWTHDTWNIFDPFQGSALGIVPGGRPRPGYSTVGSISHTFSPTTLNYFSFSVMHNRIHGLPQNGIIARDNLGLNFPGIYHAATASGPGPDLTLSGFTGYTLGDFIHNFNVTFQWRDDFTRVVGPHTLKFGAQITRSRKDENLKPSINGSVTFNVSAKNTTRNVVADALLGNYQNYSEALQDADWWSRYTQYEFYGQDSWKVSRNLSLEIGLRYNIIGPVYSALGNYSTFVPARFNPALAPPVNPRDGSLGASGDPYNGLVILGDNFPEAAKGRVPAASDPSLQRLFAGYPKSGLDIDWLDFGPRFGFAYDPFGHGKSSIRGGFGMFYDQYRTGYPSAMAGNPPFNTTVNLYDGNIDNPAGGTATRFPSNLNGILSPHMRSPMITSFNFGLQHELPGAVVLDVGYVGNLGRHLVRQLNINQLPAGTRLNPPNSSINVNALRPYPGYANITLLDNSDNSNYNSLQVAVNRRMHSGLSFGLSYTFSKTLDTAGGTDNRVGIPQDSYNDRADYGLSDIHRAHVLNFNYIYALAFFKKNTNPVLKNALAGWNIEGVTSFQSGAPNSVVVPVDVARIGATSSRASVIADPNLSNDQRTLARWFNTEAFLAPELMVQGQFGNSGRDILIGPGFSQWDVSLLKNFLVKEKTKFEFRAESFNVFNHPSFTGINTTVHFDAAGKPSQGYGAVNASGPGRVMELALKMLF
ncbi:MAG: TonB-dependent receptor [Acidobacteriaceae bacterium]|nr:TonB-dependent receptor [Acidobacteriaceae bacterium]